MRRDKSISVRFASVGGQAVKAEMRDIGATGRSAMQGISAGAKPASDDLQHFGHTAAQARLQLEAIAAKAAASAAALRTTAAATTSVQAAINKTTGVSSPTGMTAAEMLQQGQALDDLRAKFNPVYAAIRQYRSQLSELKAAHVEGAISTDELRDAQGRLRTSALATIGRLKGVGAASKEAAAASSSAASGTKLEGAALDALRAKYNPIFAAIRRYKDEQAAVRQAHADGALSADEMRAALDRLRTASLAQIGRLKDLDAGTRGAAAGSAAAANGTKLEGAALDQLRAKYNPLYGVIRRYKDEQAAVRQAHKDGALSADEMKAALDRLRTASLSQIAAAKNQVNGLDGMSDATQRANNRMQNLTYQLNDIAVTLQGGMSPFTVLMQQGPQIAQIYGFGNGGVGQIFKDIGSMILGLPGPVKAIGIAAAIGAVGVAGLTHEINKVSKVTVTVGDTAKAVFQVLGRDLHRILKPAIDPIAKWFSDMWDRVVRATKSTINDIIHAAQLLRVGFEVAIDTIPAMFQRGFYRGLAHVQLAMAEMVKTVRDALNWIADGLNAIFDTALSAPAGLTTFGVSLVDASNANWMKGEAVEGGDFMGEFRKRSKGITDTDPAGDFFGRVSDQAQKNAQERLDKDKKDKSGGREKSAKKEKDAVDDLIKSLQQELMTLRETDPVKKRLIGYADQMKDATAAERAEIERLVRALDKAEHGWEAVGRALATYSEDSKRLGDDFGASLVSAFDSAGDAFANMVAGNSSGWRDMVDQMAKDWAKLAFQQHIGGPLAAFASGWLGSFGAGGDALTASLQGAGLPAVLPSLDGGGYTGNKPRSGGLDGKGGFLAMLHPQEDVIDRTKGGRGGGGGGHVTVGVDPKSGNLQAYVDQRIQQMMPSAFDQFTRHSLPYAIRDHMNDPRSVG